MLELLLGLVVLVFIFLFCTEREFRHFVISVVVIALLLSILSYLGDLILN